MQVFYVVLFSVPGTLRFESCSIYVMYQVVEDGYEFFAKRQLVTLFSAPNYCGEFDNAGAMMSVDETLMCSFQVGQSVIFAFPFIKRCVNTVMY